MSILEKIEPIKLKLKDIANEALSEGFINAKEKEGIFQNLEKEKIIISVVGQVKYGKSTFLNALIFGKNLLPVAATPMTASLSILKYGDEAVEVEFYNQEDWNLIEEKSKENASTIDVLSSKELMTRSESIKSQILSLLGKKKKIYLKDIYDYVGAEGKYVPITKALTIWNPSERLKEISIVDTPGFNDPISSREFRAQEFLSKSDVVLVLIYSERPFDRTDKEIIFNKIRTVGTGKLVIVINKYDITLKNIGDIEKVENYIKNQIDKEIEKIEKEDKIIAKIFQNTKPIPCSALAALLGRMKKNDIENDKNLSEYFDKFKEDFPVIKTQNDFIKFSKITEVENQIDNIIKNEKLKILIRKPVTFILGKISEKKDEIDEQIYAMEAEEKGLKRTKGESEQELKSLKNAEQGVEDKTKSAVIDFQEWSKLKRNELKRQIDDMKYKLLSEKIKLQEKAWYKFADTYLNECKNNVEDELIKFKNELESKYFDFQKEQYQRLKEVITNIDCEIDMIVAKHLEYSSDIVRNLKTRFLEVLDEKVETAFESKIELDMSDTFLWWGTSKAKVSLDVRKIIDESITSDILTDPIEAIQQKFMDCLTYMDENFEDKVITPIKHALENAIRNIANREKRMGEIIKEKEKFEKRKEFLENKIKIYQDELNLLMEGKINVERDKRDIFS